jgi:uncharacterized protein (TIGR02145 family)
MLYIIKSRVIICVLPIFVLFSCNEKPLGDDRMRDAAGNVYRTVTVGDQIWMAENLKAMYTEVSNSSAYSDAKMSDFLYPNSERNRMRDYGLLYTVAAARRLVPRGWRIPTVKDFENLMHELGVNYEGGASAIKNTLNINRYPGHNSENITIDRRFALILDSPSKDYDYDYLVVQLFALDFPDNDIFMRNIYLYNVMQTWASSVRLIKDVE